MDDQEPTPPLEDFPQPPGHLREALAQAARDEVEFATDGMWPDDVDEHAVKLADVAHATRVVEHFKAGVCVHAELAKLANTALGAQEPGRWPRTIEEADDVLFRAIVTRDLVLLRDALGGKPPQEELDEPM
jgi:hypothetical protein